MRKLVLLQDLPDVRERLAALLPDFDIFIGANLDEAAPYLMGAEIVAGWNAAAAARFLESPNLRWVQAWSAGVDGYPLDTFSARGIALTTMRGVHARPIAESAFAMMLAFARGLTRALANQRDGRWARDRALFELHGATIGVLGAGAIGTEIARLAKAFDMRALGFSRSGAPVAPFDRIHTLDTLDALLQSSDYIVNVLPMTPETMRLIGARRFARMKPTACYISAGRGGTTDQRALIDALRSGTIACAGLDVFETEPLPGDSPLWSLPNVILTPHNAGATPYYDERALDIFTENIGAYVRDGRPCRNVVEYARGY